MTSHDETIRNKIKSLHDKEAQGTLTPEDASELKKLESFIKDFQDNPSEDPTNPSS